MFFLIFTIFCSHTDEKFINFLTARRVVFWLLTLKDLSIHSKICFFNFVYFIFLDLIDLSFVGTSKTELRKWCDHNHISWTIISVPGHSTNGQQQSFGLRYGQKGDLTNIEKRGLPSKINGLCLKKYQLMFIISDNRLYTIYTCPFKHNVFLC